jgi:hypothetical protein
MNDPRGTLVRIIASLLNPTRRSLLLVGIAAGALALAGCSPQIQKLTGFHSAVGFATLTRNPAITDFGNVTAHTSSGVLQITLANELVAGQGAGAITCSAPTLTNALDFVLGPSTCASIAAGGACTIDVSASPSALGDLEGDVALSCRDSTGTSQTVSGHVKVFGTQIVLAVAPLTFDFGSVNSGASSASQDFTFSNSGNASATGCAAPAMSNSTDFSITAQTCSTNPIVAGGSCTVSVRANPASAGAHTATLSRTCAVGGVVATTTNGIAVNGVVVSLAWTPLTFDFGAVPTNATGGPQTFTLANAGGAPATGCTAPTLSNTTDFTMTADNCGTTDVAATTGSCTVSIRANPSTTGARTATLSRTCTAGGTASTTTNGITVTGTAPSLAWTPLTNNFGSVNVGANSASQTFTLTNSGAGTATGCSAPSLSDATNFSIVTDNCTTANLAGGAATCTVLVRANPTSPLGAKATTLSRTCTFGGTAATTTNQIIANATDPTVPTVAITSPAANSYVGPSTMATFVVSGTCSENGRNVVLSGAATGTVACASLAWTKTVDVSASSDGTITIYADHSDALGTAAAQASRTFIKDTTPPTLSAAHMSINSGSATTASNYVAVAFTAVDTGAPITDYCLKYNSSTAPIGTDACWVGVTPVATYNAAVNFRLGFPSGAYTVYAWARNAVGLISALTNAGAGTVDQDKDAITFTPVPPPSLTGVTASSADGSVNLTIAAGGTVYIKWNASTTGTFGATPMSIFYTTDDSTYTAVNASLANAQNAGCTIAGSETGCYTWSSGSPTSSYFRIRVGSVDTNGRQSFQSSAPLNVGSTLRVIAGATDPGTGGSAAAAIFSTANQTKGWQDPESFIVTTAGVVYFADTYRGVLKIDPADGVQKLVIPIGPSIVDGSVPGTAKVKAVIRLSFDSLGNVLLWDYDRIRRYDPVANTVTTIIGGGGSQADPVAAFSLHFDSNTGGNEATTLMFGTPDGKIYFQSDNYYSTLNAGYALRVYDPGTGMVTRLNLSGTGDSYDSSQDVGACSGLNVGASFNPVTGAITSLIAQNSHQGGLCPSVGDQFPWSAFNPATGVVSGAYPTGNASYADELNVGADGTLISIDRVSGYVKKYDPATRAFTTVLGTGGSGTCADGTVATSCAVDLSDATTDANGKMYFLERGKIRTIDQSNLVYTVMGSGYTAGDGGAAISARIGSISDVKLWNNGTNDKVVLADSSEFRLREFDIDGNIQTVAGNGSAGHPNTTTAAAGQPLAYNDDASISILTIQVNPADGTIYSSAVDNNHISKIDRSTGKWVNIVGGGGTTYDGATADGKLGNQLYLPGYNARLFGFDGTNLAAQIYQYTNSSMLKTYAVSNGTQSALAGVQGTNGNFAADGTAGTASTVPGTQDAVESGIWDAFGSRWIFGAKYSNQKPIRFLAAGGNLGTVATLTNTPTSFTYRHDASNNMIYYCSGGKLYKYNVTTTTNTALSWPITAMQCSGRAMVYSASRSSLIVPFIQNGIGGVLEYFNP